MVVTQVLNYHDVQLYDSDVALFATHQWLNDNAINFYFQYLVHDALCERNGGAAAAVDDLLLMDPAVVSCMMLQCDDDDEYEDLGRGLNLDSKRVCFIPVNDNDQFGGESTHWSLLVYRRQERSFAHYDSSSGHNTHAAKKITTKFEKMLRLCGVIDADSADENATKATFVSVRETPQQRNGYDCGMYVLVIAEYLCRKYVYDQRQSGDGYAEPMPSMQAFATPERVTRTRLEMPALVQRLQREQQAASGQRYSSHTRKPDEEAEREQHALRDRAVWYASMAHYERKPKIGQVERNMAHVDHLIESLDDGIDVLMLSEMALTGYVFETKEEAAALAEVSDKGKTFAWCQRHARRLRCMVMCGYIERDAKDEDLLYNAMMVLSPEGELVCNPRKTFLYETDKVWATAGDGFTTWHCSWLNKTISFGICMDINPYEFTAAFDEFEFATQVVSHGSDLVLFSCAWCDFDRDETDTFPTLSYWATRLTPIIDALHTRTYPKPNCHFLVSNRIGEENGTYFVGASCALSLRQPQVLASATRHDEAVLRVEIP
ncbi:Ubiquitin1-specific protease, partial [Globisporangium splendens]